MYDDAAPPPGGVFFIDDGSFEMRIMTTLPMDDLKKRVRPHAISRRRAMTA